MIEELLQYATAHHTAKVLSRKYCGQHSKELDDLILDMFHQAIEQHSQSQSQHKQDSGERSAGETE